MNLQVSHLELAVTICDGQSEVWSSYRTIMESS